MIGNYGNRQVNYFIFWIVICRMQVRNIKYEIICDNKEIDLMFYIIKFDILGKQSKNY